MDVFWKAASVVILTVILGANLGKTEKDIAAVLRVIACCVIMIIALQYLSEVIDFLWILGNRADSQNPYITILLKISGVALISEMICLISSDSGNSSLGKAIQFLGNAVILSLSLPFFDTLLSLIQEIMGYL